jgi:asparagine synthase (glutamine-hydrolysing)
MCGFVGTTNKHLCELMLKKQEHRGPDALSFWSDDRLSLGHALLDISGSKQTQPIRTKYGSYVLFNGEMYDSRDQNDTVWLGKMLDKYGTAVLEWSDWHGSIAYYKPQENKLLLIRDQFGTKPLWWGFDGETFQFSTSCKSFLHKELQTKERKFGSMGDECIWKGFHKVEPGGMLEFDLNDNFKLRRSNLWNWFTLNKTKFNPEEFIEKTKASILKVADHGNSSNKHAIFLSGGFDSTLVASICRESTKDITLFTCGYSNEKGNNHEHMGFQDESRMAKKTAELFGRELVHVDLGRDQRIALGKTWLSGTHYAWSDHNRQAPRYLLARTAAEHGCKVVLTGDSGDELYSGYMHHDKRFNEEYCLAMIEQYRKERWFPSDILDQTDPMAASLFIDLLTTSEQNILATDQTCGLFGMESRIPLLTQRYVHYNMTIPTVTRFKQMKEYELGTTKYLMREVMKDYLPDHVVKRKQKTGWSSPWDNNHREQSLRWRDEDLELLKRLGA